MVHTFSPGLWDFAEYALYHTEEDPRETADVKARYPEVLARMQALEAEWLERTLHGAPDLAGHNDHRVVMSLAVLSAAAGLPLTVDDAEAIQKSWPNFFAAIRPLGVEVEYA